MKNIEWLTIFVFSFGLFSLGASAYFASTGIGFRDYSYGIMIGIVLLVTAVYYHIKSTASKKKNES